ncbi:MAG: hypothetical protein HC888_02625 [Candidatus Competibacteraceae bacterium]|nr:hypothetical protein [Candidatus Competibacteraceae bacterium]
MLFHRANAFAHSDAFPDVNTGIHTDEEMSPEAFAQANEEWIRKDDEIIRENMKRQGVPMSDEFRVEDPTEEDPMEEATVRKTTARTKAATKKTVIAPTKKTRTIVK